MSQHVWPFIAPDVPSRSYYDDDDQTHQQTQQDHAIETLYTTPIFRVSQATGATKLDAGVLVIGLPGAGALFLHAAFPHKRLVGVLVMPGAVEFGWTPASDMGTPGTAFYQPESHPHMIVGLCWHAVSVERAYSWAKCVSEHVDAKQIVVLDSLSSGTYRPAEYEADEVAAPWLRKLSTSGSEKIDAVPYLEAPNMLIGMSAALLTLMEISGHKSTYCYASLLEKMHGKERPSEESLKAYEQVLSSFNIKIDTAIKYSAALSQYLTLFKGRYNTDNAMYL
ncbi:hypothetical protein SeMB42_g03015 [Synchytrium endobioticum]|uniref:Proteasome assembly chaperone 1 n=1 Tax=Synchytrium endobioticum TaxID=286115 RepID=A0A507DA27_9FUNG|nr:hypothetical protein SeLEV6574_g02900 [Synchytrium endobioticum]TPX48413.1 hypothetical protein SeMB42_g03015 [Synchytrium endobioticum]